MSRNPRQLMSDASVQPPDIPLSAGNVGGQERAAADQGSGLVASGTPGVDGPDRGPLAVDANHPAVVRSASGQASYEVPQTDADKLGTSSRRRGGEPESVTPVPDGDREGGRHGLPDRIDTPLDQAVRSGDQRRVQELLVGGDACDTPNHNGFTPLIVAVRMNAVEIARTLLQGGARPNRAGIYEWTPLHWAARLGHDQIVELLLDSGADAAARSDTFATPLHQAAGQGHCTTLKILFATGAVPIDVESGFGLTPLWWAVRGGHPEAVRWLVAHGASPNPRLDIPATPLQWAIWEANEAVIEVLLEAGADPHVDDEWYQDYDGAATEPQLNRIRQRLTKAATDRDG